MRKQIWTIEKIHIGFQNFLSKNGRLPRAEEIDILSDLPSSRLIQKRFGGLESLRKQLGYDDTHFGKGRYRGAIAHKVNHRGRAEEISLQTHLSDHFGEVFVHTEKLLIDSKIRVDFYVYSPDGNFAADVFYSDSLRTLQSNVNIKVPKYVHHPTTVYLVSANESLSQEVLDLYSQSKKNPLPSHILLVSLERFTQLVDTMGTFPNPLL